MGLDTETSGLRPWESEIKLIILSTPSHIYLIDPTNYKREFIISVFEELNRCSVVVAHNAKFDCGFIYYQYGVLINKWWCTMLASQIHNNGKLLRGTHSLPDVIYRYLNEKSEFSSTKKLLQKSFTSQYSLGQFSERQLRYASDDVKFLLDLYKTQRVALDSLHLDQIYRLENTLIPILSKMEMEGCLIDKSGWQHLIKTTWVPGLHEIERLLDFEVTKLNPATKQRRKAIVEILSLFDDQSKFVTVDNGAINFASSEQILQLFRSLGEKVPTKPDGTESVDEGILTTYVNENPTSRLKPLIKLLIEHRVMAKRISTYGEKFLGMLDHSSKIHTAYTQTFTTTGRLSSKSPNLQNIPSPEKGNPDTDIRRFFVARPGYKFITCDMSSAEVAIAADYSQEPLLLNALRNGVDMHSDLASISFSIIFGQPVTISMSEEPITINGLTFIPGELRYNHKSVVFAKFYKAGAKRIYSVLAGYINLFHPEERRLEIATEISKALDKRMPKLSKYLSGLIRKAQREGFLIGSRLGRIRYFDGEVYGEAANLPIQNTNAEALKLALIDVYNLFKENPNWDARIVLNVHDEIVCEVRDEYVEEVAPLVKGLIAGALSSFLKTIKGGASVSISQHWKK